MYKFFVLAVYQGDPTRRSLGLSKPQPLSGLASLLSKSRRLEFPGMQGWWKTTAQDSLQKMTKKFIPRW